MAVNMLQLIYDEEKNTNIGEKDFDKLIIRTYLRLQSMQSYSEAMFSTLDERDFYPSNATVTEDFEVIDTSDDFHTNFVKKYNETTKKVEVR